MSISRPRDEASIAGRERVYSDARRAAGWGISVNIFLVVAKLAGGLFTGSSALIADAVNSIGDVASALAVRGALALAQKEEDDDHPYGHTKAESIAGLCVALLVTFSAALLAVETARRFTMDLAIPSSLAAVVAGGCAIIKETIYRYTQRVATRLGSSSLKASALDHRSDAMASACVAVSLLVAPYLGPYGVWVDPVAGLGVCMLLIVTGLRMFATTAAELMDQQADSEFVDRVRVIALGVEPVVDVEKLRVRKSGLEYFIEIHIEVDGHLTVNEGHRIGHQVKDILLLELPRVRDVHVHIEPYGE